ncbi:MAG: DNA mismatch repair endonuclease MutL [Chlamydiota bacterium]
MSTKIHLLSSQTINQIAAGEVIENPASVVKELVENAVDAGARKIVVETLGGGFQSIVVSDDGIGMGPEDARLSLERHATSKIVSADDLFALSSMGFRGEALASIASVSKMTLQTAADGFSPVTIEVEGGRVLHADPAGRARGTTIEVRSLFYNVPARKKFQKSVAASTAEITKVMTQLALAHPQVGFELIHQKRCLFSLPNGHGSELFDALKLRAIALLGEEFLNSCHPLVLREEEFQVTGFVASPQFSRPNRSGQSLFINRRPVVCFGIAHAVRDAYGTRLSTDRHPVFLLHFAIDSSLVDVNVHPQKKEVRLREQDVIKYKIRQAVNNAFMGKEELERPVMGTDWPFAMQSPVFSEEPVLRLREERTEIVQEALPLQRQVRFLGVYQHYLIVDAHEVFPDEGKEGVCFIDLPAAEATIWFDRMVSSATATSSQRLLFPLTLCFSKGESALLLSGMREIVQLGIDMHQVGDGAFMIEAIPPFLLEREIEDVLHTLIAEMQELETAKSSAEKRLSALAAKLSASVRRRKKNYLQDEALRIASELLKLKNFRHCPLGGPTTWILGENEIGSGFKRGKVEIR